MSWIGWWLVCHIFRLFFSISNPQLRRLEEVEVGTGTGFAAPQRKLGARTVGKGNVPSL